jgi:urea transport system substrate-binding protein
MERLPGETLEKRLERDVSIPVDEALWITRQVAEGLAAAHEHQLIHRDVKPSNIWLLPASAGARAAKGRPGRVVLLDFGIAKRANDDRNLTTVGQVIGTPSYMAPEQAMGLPVDRRADIYSLGCVLYQMVTGHSPFEKEGKETVAVLEAVIRGEPPPVDWKVPSLPVAVAVLIKDMMSRDVRERPTSAAALIERIEHINDEPPIVPTASNAKPSRQADRVGIVLFGVVAVMVVGVLTFGLWKWLGPGGPPIRVGILHSLTGPLSGHEKPIVHATRLAIDEINASGGVLGRQLEPIQADGASKEEIFGQMAEQLITEDEVKVVFGCWTSSARKRVGAVCQRESRLLFYPENYEGLGENPYVVYMGGTPNQTLLPLVNWAHHELKKRRFFLLGSENVFSHTANAIMKHEIEKGLKAEVVGELYAAVGKTSMDEYAKAIKASGADFVINTLDIQSNVPLVKALRDRGITPATVPTAWCGLSETELSQFHKGELEGDYSVANYFESLDVRSNREFVKRFHARFPAERVNDVMQTAYAGVYMWKKAVEKAGTTDTEKVRAALAGMTVDAPEGPIRLSKDLHAYRVPMIGQIVYRDGKYQFKKVAGGDGPVPPQPIPPWWEREKWHEFQKGLYERWGQKWEKH